jgi:DNA-3-methyladenine glycosylase
MAPRRNRYRPLGRKFFGADAVTLAQELLGRVLVHDHADGRTAGLIVETEAYEQTDPASHSFPGPTERNRVMFGPGGFAYIYRSYGVHWCANVVAGPAGFGAAVLLRALAPLEGVDLMRARRRRDDTDLELARGPGRLCQAMGIDLTHYGLELCEPPLFIADPPGGFVELPRRATARIGISKATERLWRFCVTGHPSVSGPRALR